MTKLTDTLELWLQEQINTTCRGLFDRIDRLEVQRLRDEDAIRNLFHLCDKQEQLELLLRAEIGHLSSLSEPLEMRAKNAERNMELAFIDIRTQNERVTELEDRLVERTPDEQLSSFTDRVCEVFDTEPFKTTVEGIVADWVADSDVVCSTEDVVRILEETTFKIRVR